MKNRFNRLELPHGETRREKQYVMPCPDSLIEEWATARGKVFDRGQFDMDAGKWTEEFDPSTLTYEELVALTSLAEGYIHLTTYELGQECCVQKLRDIWRARMAQAAQKEEE